MLEVIKSEYGKDIMEFEFDYLGELSQESLFSESKKR